MVSVIINDPNITLLPIHSLHISTSYDYERPQFDFKMLNNSN